MTFQIDKPRSRRAAIATVNHINSAGKGFASMEVDADGVPVINFQPLAPVKHISITAVVVWPPETRDEQGSAP